MQAWYIEIGRGGCHDVVVGMVVVVMTWWVSW